MTPKTNLPIIVLSTAHCGSDSIVIDKISVARLSLSSR
jgi:hypothetical protein